MDYLHAQLYDEDTDESLESGDDTSEEEEKWNGKDFGFDEEITDFVRMSVEEKLKQFEEEGSKTHTQRVVAVMKYRAGLRGDVVCCGRKKRNGKNGPQKKGRTRKRKGFNAWSDQVGSTVSLRSPILAAELRVPMVLEGDFTVPGGSSTGSVRFNPNALYQPVTGGATAAINGYAPYALQYGFYRVMSYSYTVRFVNNEAFPVAVFVTNSDNDYGTAPAITAAANPLSQRRTLGPLTGQCMGVIRQRVHVSEVAGTRAVAYADSYRSLNNTTPADLMWLGVSAASMTGTALSVSVRFEMHLVMNVLWHDRLQQ